MKQIISLLLVAMSMATSAVAQSQTATLQQGDDLKAFYGIDAFREAYTAARNGAVITLSAGQFNPPDSIMKQITVKGNGYK